MKSGNLIVNPIKIKSIINEIVFKKRAVTYERLQTAFGWNNHTDADYFNEYFYLAMEQ